MSLEHAKEKFIEAGNAQALIIDTMVEFQAACSVNNWDRAEAARDKCHGAVDSFFDSVRGAYKAPVDGGGS